MIIVSKYSVLGKPHKNKVLLLVARPLREGGGGWPLRKKNFSEAREKSRATNK